MCSQTSLPTVPVAPQTTTSYGLTGVMLQTICARQTSVHACPGVYRVVIRRNANYGKSQTPEARGAHDFSRERV